MVWDGDCTFCRFWKERWESMSDGKIDFAKFQLASTRFPDIKKTVFQKSIVLITTEGQVYLAAAAVFKSYEIMGIYSFLNQYYYRFSWFKNSSEKLYRYVADNRNLLMKLTVLFFGRDPQKLKHFWIIYLLLLLLVLFLAVNFW